MVSWGEGPHITALMLLPLAIGALYLAIIRRTPASYFAAALAMAAAALSNWIGRLCACARRRGVPLGELRRRMAAPGLSSPAGPMPSRRHS